MDITLDVLERRFAIHRADPGQLSSAELDHDAVFCVVRSREELSVVADTNFELSGTRVNAPWCALRVRGPLDFAEIGILARISGALTDARVSVFVVSTFDTDYVLVPEASLDSAVSALMASGMEIGAA